MNTAELTSIQDCGWPLPPETWLCLPDAEQRFAMLEMAGQRTRAYYQARLQCLGFARRGRVLDCACGMGQWAVALADIGNEVLGVDINAERLLTATQLARAAQARCTFRQGEMEHIPAGDGEFDGIFCYGAFMFAHMPRALTEFRRVLRPGGHLYLNANSWGWYAHLVFDRGLRTGNWRVAVSGLRMVLRTFAGCGRTRVVTSNWLADRLTTAGFTVLARGAEGTIRVNGSDARLPDPAYPPRFYRLPAVVEVLANRET